MKLKTFGFWGVAALFAAVTLSGCGKKVYMPVSTPEEAGLNLRKITDDTKASVVGIMMLGGSANSPSFAMMGTNKEHGVHWGAHRTLSVSPDGEELAYLTRVKDKDNIMVRSTSGSNAMTQRTSRNVGDFCWGVDDNLYFVDVHDNQSNLCSVDAHAGTFMRQITSNNYDYQPVLSPDGKKLFFTRYEKNSGPSVWSYELENGQLTSCAPGFQPTGISEDGNEFYCVRNSDKGFSEIWKVNYVTGRETCILADQDRSYTHPALSPDGEWLLVTGNTKSSINKKKNLDIFALKLDGSNMFLQLTYHPGNDTNPQWSADGNTIFFISDRANKDERFNVWRMNFNDPSIQRVKANRASTTPQQTSNTDNSASDKQKTRRTKKNEKGNTDGIMPL